MTDLSLFERFAWLALVASTVVGCADELPSYNELEGFRVLALRASPPSLGEGESTTLDALTFVEGNATPELRYRWSWCPARLPTASGGGCAIGEAEFARLLGVDERSIDYDLGGEATTTLVYPGSPDRYRAACENSAGAEGAIVFVCDGGFPLSVRAEITYGEKTIHVQKEVRLRFADAHANENPRLGAVSVAKIGTESEPWNEGRAASMDLGGRYEVRVEVDEASAESFVPSATEIDPSPGERRESLFISWFTTSGEMDSGRTSFVENGVSLAEFGTNEWALPKSGDEQRDEARLFLVLRDERGGVDWLSREVELER